MNPSIFLEKKMEIKPSIIKIHENLSKSSVRFLDFARQNPASLKLNNYDLLELNDPLFKLQPWPTFINQPAKNEIEEASLKVLNLLRSVPARIFSNDCEKISRYYGLSVDLAEYFLYGVTDEHLDNLLARGDFVITESGIKCLEYNINTNLGGMNLPLWESLYLATPVISEFLNKYKVKIHNRNLYSFLFEQLINAASTFYTDCEEVNIAIVMPQGLDDPYRPSQERYLNSVYRDVLYSQFDNLKGQVFICDFSHIKVVGEDVFRENKKLHYLVEWCQGYLPVEILDLFKERKILISNGAIAWLLSTKLNLALLSENKDSDLFSPEEKEMIEKYIPWTRKVVPGETTYEGEKIQLEEFILANREKLVLKPLLGAGGKDIYIGCHKSEKEWKELAESAMKWNDWKGIHISRDLNEKQWFDLAERAYKEVKNWVVQEYIESPRYLYQLGENGCAEHHAVWGFFIFGNTYAGGWVRVLPANNDSGIINCHQGAKVSVLFEVDE